MLMLVLFMSVAFTSCGDDDDDEPVVGNIVGTWVSTEKDDVGTQSECTKTYTFCFNSNGTGYRSTSYVYVTGSVSSDTYQFTYVQRTKSDGVIAVTTTDLEDNYQQTWEIVQTGNTMMIGNRVYTRK